MPARKGWTSTGVLDGVETISLESHTNFHNYVEEIEDPNQFIWRGHRRGNWQLESTLHRVFKKIGKSVEREWGDEAFRRGGAVADHLFSFHYSTRDRQGTPGDLAYNDDQWWAVGQHNGLATPLLDWTSSPYVALFFAFEKEDDLAGMRAVLAISKKVIEEKRQSGYRTFSVEEYPPPPETDEERQLRELGLRCPTFVDPLRGDPRMISQRGVFTSSKYDDDLETLIKEIFSGEETCALKKILIPNVEREACLKSLNRMNINHLTLFPDMFGSSQYSNLKLFIEDY
ncbi:MAG: FRG domain-containing protein [Thermoleophilia bacterium]